MERLADPLIHLVVGYGTPEGRLAVGDWLQVCGGWDGVERGRLNKGIDTKKWPFIVKWKYLHYIN